MTSLYILGAGGHGAVVAEVASACGLPIAGFCDDDPARAGTRVLDWPVLGGCECVPAGATVVLAVGHNGVRAHLLALARAQGWDLPVLVHPSAVISPSASLAAGTVVMPLVVVNARTQIGPGVILNTACSVDHDCHLAEAVHIAPGGRLAGSIEVGARTLIGVGASVRPGIVIGADCLVGAGAAVIREVPDGVQVVGNPARILVRRAH
jgi:sugar O-acyltransferase (sialic acid O-acetyltransferase NeuD family)